VATDVTRCNVLPWRTLCAQSAFHSGKERHHGLDHDRHLSPRRPAAKRWPSRCSSTEKLVDSPNTKVVVIGNPKNGLPLILGQQPRWHEIRATGVRPRDKFPV